MELVVRGKKVGFCFCMTLLVFSGCLLFMPLQQARAEAPAYVRMIHASPYIGIADIFVDGKKLLGSFEFGAVTGYVPVPVGAHKIQISAVGKGIGAAVLTQNISITAGTVYTVAALGVSPQALTLQAFIDDNRLETGMAKVRVYHLSPDYGRATIEIGKDARLKDIYYRTASPYLLVPPGSCTLKATAPQATVSLPAILPPNKVTSIFVIGTVKAMPELRLVSAQSAGILSSLALEKEPRSAQSPSQDFFQSQPFLAWLFSTLFVFVFTAVSLTLAIGLLRRVQYA